MEENDKKNLRVFYLSLAVVLTVVAIMIIAITVAKRSEPVEPPTSSTQQSQNTPSSDNTDAGLDEENKLPVFVSPLLECTLDMDFSDTVLVFSPTMEDYRTHTAIDLTAPLGTEVMAVADGVVKNIWHDPFMGTCVSIEHTGNAVSYYKNLDPVVKEGLVIGASVKAGDVIGAVGESAMNEIAQDPHLHFELKVDDKCVNPKDHIKFPFPNQKPESENK